MPCCLLPHGSHNTLNFLLCCLDSIIVIDPLLIVPARLEALLTLVLELL